MVDTDADQLVDSVAQELKTRLPAEAQLNDEHKQEIRQLLTSFLETDEGRGAQASAFTKKQCTRIALAPFVCGLGLVLFCLYIHMLPSSASPASLQRTFFVKSAATAAKGGATESRLGCSRQKRRGLSVKQHQHTCRRTNL